MPRTWKKEAKDPASIATTDIAHPCRKMSRTRAGVEIGFGSWDETVRSWVLVQNSESPMLVISVRSACRSKKKMSRLATASSATVTTKRENSRERRR